MEKGGRRETDMAKSTGVAVRHRVNQCWQNRVFDLVVFVLVTVCTLVVLYPLIFVVIASISDPHLVQSGQVILWPKGISLEGYRYIFKDNRIWTGYRNTMFNTVAGTLFAMFLTIPAGYAFSRKDLRGRNILMGLFIFTMYFGGGLIPTYLVVKNIGLIDSIWTLVVLGSFSVYNLIICRTFFQSSIPMELQEAAEMDGCTIMKFFFLVVLPLSKPILAIMALYYAVGKWNDFFNGLIYVNRAALFPLQLIMRDILIQGQAVQASGVTDPEQIKLMQQIAMTIKYGAIIVSSLPVLIFYPFIQKYFVKGVMIGSVKG